jgi:hypothetical protein
MGTRAANILKEGATFGPRAALATKKRWPAPDVTLTPVRKVLMLRFFKHVQEFGKHALGRAIFITLCAENSLRCCSVLGFSPAAIALPRTRNPRSR